MDRLFGIADSCSTCWLQRNSYMKCWQCVSLWTPAGLRLHTCGRRFQGKQLQLR